MGYHPVFSITAHALNALSEASELKAWIQQSVVDVAWLPRLQRETTERLAHSSTAIEGNPLTLTEVQSLARGEILPGAERVAREVSNYLAAIRWIGSKKQQVKITASDILHLHRLVTQKLLVASQVGRYKTKSNRIVDHRGRTVYTPPPPEKAGVLTLALLEWLNGPAALKLHPMLVSAIAHHRLVSIHPFADGNGRIARALAIWLLYARGFDLHHLFALDEYYESDRQRYYLKIQQARELDDDLTYWLEYVAVGVVKTLSDTRERIECLKIASRTTPLTLTRRQEEVLRFLRGRGYIPAHDIAIAFKVTRSRIQQIVKPLVEAGLVTRRGETRATLYGLA